MQQFVYSEAELIRLCNDIREVILQDLTVTNYITQDQRNLYLHSRVLIGYRPSWFGKIWARLNNQVISKNSTGDTFTIIPIALSYDENLEMPPKGTLHLIKEEK